MLADTSIASGFTTFDVGMKRSYPYISHASGTDLARVLKVIATGLFGL